MSTIVNTIRQNFSPLQIRNFRLYLGGQAVSMIGTWLQSTAQAWVVWELTGSEAALGIVAMLATLPLLVLGPWAGTWADRLDRRKVLIASQGIMMLLAFTLAMLVQTGVVQIWHVYLLALLLGTVTAIDLPSHQAFLGDLSGMSQVRRAVNLNAMIVQISRMLGPALAGFVIAQLGVSTAFWLNGLSFLAVIFSLLAVRSAQAPSRAGAESGGFVAGLRFIRTQPRLQDLMLFVAMLTFFGLSIINIFPSVASEVLHGDAQTLGFLMAASGAGALVGTLIIIPIAQAQKRIGVVVAGMVIWMGLWYSVMSRMHWLPLAMICIFLAGLAGPTVFTTALGMLQVHAPPDMRARLLSLYVMVSFGMQPVASLLIGYSAEHLGTPTAILINGLALAGGASCMLLFRPELRRWEASAAPGSAPAAATAAAD